MSERITHHEHEQSAENSAEHAKKSQELLNHAKHEAHKSEKESSHIEDLRSQIEKHAKTKDEQESQRKDSEPEVANTYWFSQEYRTVAYKQLLSKTRTHLSRPQKAVSRLIHQPTIEKYSEIGSKTVARPSGVLSGSILSFITSLAVYLVSKRNGYDMTYTIFIISFIGGFIAGVVIELAYRSVRLILSRD